MEQYIKKSALVAELESLRCTTFTNFDEGVNATVQILLETLDTLEVKEVDLKEEVERFAKASGYKFAATIDFQFAEHFFALGMAVSNKALKGE